MKRDILHVYTSLILDDYERNIASIKIIELSNLGLDRMLKSKAKRAEDLLDNHGFVGHLDTSMRVLFGLMFMYFFIVLIIVVADMSVR